MGNLTYYTADVQKTKKGDPAAAFVINENDSDKEKILAMWRAKAKVEAVASENEDDLYVDPAIEAQKAAEPGAGRKAKKDEQEKAAFDAKEPATK